MDHKTPTNLAGTNSFEVVIFKLSGAHPVQHFGINVYKVRELLTYAEPVRLPRTSAHPVQGVLKVRDEIVGIFDLAQTMNIDLVNPALLVLSEFAGQTLAFPVHSVEGIERVEWGRVTPAGSLLGSAGQGRVTGVLELDDGRLVTLLDVESLVAEHIDLHPTETKEVKPLATGHKALFAEDSRFARKIVSNLLTSMGVPAVETHDGQEAWEKLLAMAASGELPSVVVTDIEMPRMDGYTLTRRIKSHPQMSGVKVVMYSSLSASANERMGLECGADAYCGKFQSEALAKDLRRLLA